MKRTDEPICQSELQAPVNSLRVSKGIVKRDLQDVNDKVSVGMTEADMHRIIE